VKSGKFKELSSQKIELVDFQEQYAQDFADINLEWLEKYFYVEEYDREVLNNPQK